MAWDKGFNFRNSAGFVIDGANETYVLATDMYPTVRNGVTFGWINGTVDDRDRTTGTDRRLAGVNFSVLANFRIDLPSAGTYNLELAQGDVFSPIPNMRLQIYDDTSLLYENPAQAIAINTFLDTTNTARSGASWPASHAVTPFAFATTTLIVRIERVLPGGTNGEIAHLFVSQAAAGGVSIPVMLHHLRQQGIV